MALSSLFKDLSPEPTSFVLKYPEVGGIEIKEEDVAFLEDGQMINDTIIDFYLSYIYKEIIPAEFQERTHIFSSFFLSFLLRTFSPKNTGTNEYDVKKSVNKWIKNVDIFSKDFIFVPVNRRNHWYLVVICFLTQLNQNNCEETNLEDDSNEAEMSSDNNHSGSNSPNATKVHPYQNKGKPCFCIFDSLDEIIFQQRDQKSILLVLYRFLKMIWIQKHPKIPYNLENLICFKPECPQQENGVDCGLYVLQYVESFFKNPIPYIGHPMPDLKNWFPKQIIDEKRSAIKKVISELKAKQTLSVQVDSSNGSDVMELSEN